MQAERTAEAAALAGGLPAMAYPLQLTPGSVKLDGAPWMSKLILRHHTCPEARGLSTAGVGRGSDTEVPDGTA